MKAPFIWFGGKRRVASLVWRAFGDVDNYVEPFAGSLAVLLERPAAHCMSVETVNDADGYLCNFWRAIKSAPDEVARWCDWPVNETDLFARHLWLVNEGRSRIAAMESDPDFFDAKVAGWWVWGINAWIGSGWCQGNGPWRVVNGEPQLTNGRGGQCRQLPHLGHAGQGEKPETPCSYYFDQLCERLRRVRVCCGDWSRVVTDGALSYGDNVGVFLDPPYLGDVRAKDLYRIDDHSLSHEVREWAIASGDNPRFRIILAGYRDEHEDVMPATWARFAYSASKAYGTTAAVDSGIGNDANRHKEMLWFSPHCRITNHRQTELFVESCA